MTRRLTLGQKASDWIAVLVGSWRFIIWQLIILGCWIGWNTYHPSSYDPYPFILLNLALSFQAAFTAPVIMMSQNRQGLLDRHKQEQDYHVNVRAEKEIAALHAKLDALKDQEIKELLEVIKRLLEKGTNTNVR